MSEKHYPLPTYVVANQFITIAKRKKVELTHEKLQYLVYLTHGFYLATSGAPLVNEPVLPGEYLFSSLRAIAHYSADGLARAVIQPQDEEMHAVVMDDFRSNDLLLDLIECVWSRYADLTDAEIIEECIAATFSNRAAGNTPFETVHMATIVEMSISNALIYDYFRKLTEHMKVQNGDREAVVRNAVANRQGKIITCNFGQG